NDYLCQRTAEFAKKQLAGLLPAALPRRLAELLLVQAGLPANRKAAAFGRHDRGRLVHEIKHLRLPITGTLGFRKAEVTVGALDLADVDSRTLQSNLLKDLFIAGEVLDLDGPIGGYTFQAAFSTGWLAGAVAGACH